MLSLPVCPLRHTFRVSEPVLPYLQHASCFQPRAAPRPHLARAIKNPTARLAVGDKVKNSAVPPRLTRHRYRTLSSTANTVRLLTRALRPRLLVTFRLGPPGPILSGSVPAGITPSPTLSQSVSRFLPVNGLLSCPTLSQSVSRFLPVNGLLSCFYAITAFSSCQRILTRFFKFSARSSPNARRARTRAHTCSCAHMLVRTPYHCCSAPPDKFSPVRFTQMPSAPAQAPFPRTSARAADQHDLVRSTKSCPTAYGMFCIE